MKLIPIIFTLFLLLSCGGEINSKESGIQNSASPPREDSANNNSSTEETVYYYDGDGDGYGDLNTSSTSRNILEGYVTIPGDCNDNDPSINPMADEICDSSEIDENCDNSVNEGCECVGNETRNCGSNVGECVAGIQTCVNGQWGECEGETGPKRDKPNADNYLDENCDGVDGEINNAYWVSSSEGNDNNSGTIDKPFKTIEAAMNARPLKDLYLVGGHYIAEEPNLSYGIGIYGGYGNLQNGTRPRDISQYETSINAYYVSVSGNVDNIDSNQTLEGINIEGTTGTPTILLYNTSLEIKYSNIYSNGFNNEGESYAIKALVNSGTEERIKISNSTVNSENANITYAIHAAASEGSLTLEISESSITSSGENEAYGIVTYADDGSHANLKMETNEIDTVADTATGVVTGFLARTYEPAQITQVIMNKNKITATGISNARGVVIANTSDFTVTNNYIKTEADTLLGSNNFGIIYYLASGNFINNTVYSSGIDNNLSSPVIYIAGNPSVDKVHLENNILSTSEDSCGIIDLSSVRRNEPSFTSIVSNLFSTVPDKEYCKHHNLSTAWKMNSDQLNDAGDDFHHNISGDALLDVDGFHITATSPAVDSGYSELAPPDDIDGEERLSGIREDIGADEYSD